MFDVDSFLNDSKLKPYKIYRKGELPEFPKNKSKKTPYKENGCYFDASKADFDNLDKQISDAIRFLKKNFKHFEVLPEYGFKKTDKPTLDFGIESRMNRNTVVQCDLFPSDLLLLCGQLGFGIELSQYQAASKK